MRDRWWKSLVLTVVAVVGIAGVLPVAAAGQTSVDGSPAETPTSVVAVEAGADGVALSWQGSEGAVEYAIWRDGRWHDWVAAPTTSYTDEEPLSGSRYQIRALGSDGAWSRWSKSVEVGAVESLGQVSAPAGVVATSSLSTVELSWDAVPGALEYAIWRDGRWYSWARAPKTSYVDTNPLPVADYEIRTLNAEGVWSEWSEPVVCGTAAPSDDSSDGPDVVPPFEVSGIRVTDKRPDDFVTLSWDPAADNGEVAFYEVLVQVGLIGTNRIDEATVFTTTSTQLTIPDQPDGGLWLGDQFGNNVWVRAVDDAGNRGPITEGGPSLIRVTEDDAVIAALAPEFEDRALPADGPAPTVVAGEGQVELTWVNIVDNFSALDEVYRDGQNIGFGVANGECDGPDCELGVNIVGCAGSDCVLGFVDTNAVPGQTYTYYLRARDGQGNLSPSWETVTVTAR